MATTKTTLSFADIQTAYPNEAAWLMQNYQFDTDREYERGTDANGATCYVADDVVLWFYDEDREPCALFGGADIDHARALLG